MRIDDSGVSRLEEERDPRGVAWGELVAVSIVKASRRAFDEAIYFVLSAADGHGCVVSGRNAREQGLVSRLVRLPRFDNDALSHALELSDGSEIVCWQGAPGEGLVAGTPVAELH